MPKWNGYVIEVGEKTFEFNCRHCSFNMNRTFEDTPGLKTLRDEWQAHVDMHGGPYA